jgi:hypothetical protein
MSSVVKHANGTEAAAVIRLIFQGNSVQVSAQRVILPVVSSLPNHYCNPNTARQYPVFAIQANGLAAKFSKTCARTSSLSSTADLQGMVLLPVHTGAPPSW